MELKGKERQFFKKEAHSLKPIFQIGKGGLSEEMIHQIQNAVEKRDFITKHIRGAPRSCRNDCRGNW